MFQYSNTLKYAREMQESHPSYFLFLFTAPNSGCLSAILALLLTVANNLHIATMRVIKHRKRKKKHRKGTTILYVIILFKYIQDKLSQLNVPDSTCRWITDFLSDRGNT